MERIKNKKVLLIIASIVITLVICIIGGIVIKNNKNENESSKGSGIFSKKEDVKIKESETASIKYTNFNNGLVSMDIPEGWETQVIGDCIHYTIKVYNPKDTAYQFFFNMKTEGYNKSQDAKNFQKKYYPDSIFAKNPVISEKTTEGFYKIFNELGPVNNTTEFTFPTLTNFKVTEKIGKSTINDGDILRATFKNENGKEAEGIFTAYVYDAGPYYVQENVFSGKKIDIYYLNVYNTMFITAPKDELINWESVLNKMASSLQFTDTFVNQFYSQEDAVMKNFQNVRNICNQMTDSIMYSWESRNASYDIMSQKQSDATLGYERVYNTETGDVYKAYNGFTDDYDGKKYQSITDDMYTKSIKGYIEK